MSFSDTLNQYDWDKTKADIYSKTKQDVLHALNQSSCSLEDFKALISPAAAPYLEQMAQKSMLQTQKRFGKTIQLYVPLYLSNTCSNACVYCGFSHKNKIERVTLSEDQILKEAMAIKKMGFDHLLLVTGEHQREAGFDYLMRAIEILRPHFSQISVEVQPMSTEEYQQLMKVGLHAVYVYQETYHQENYKSYHPAGKKADFKYRLETPDRLGKAGIHKIGLGCLLGLEDWRSDIWYTALHLSYLERTYWQSRYSISFPRLRPSAGGFQPNMEISDRELLQVICAFRLLNQEIELSLSTRETPTFRDNVFKLGITAMSAGSKTEPGGYAVHTKALEQFEVSDQRSPKEVEEMLHKNQYEAVWKDWDKFM
ncbi:2-iminoacetate synthase ThiH [Ancylomarina sp. DW003]|nr:2-iminoacetate synthase ThiH [Ancylomarina sp. DW003]MDE5421354.1 2-iminoacetate synthase ThiH [Ancylomarina sp. DW003]